MFENFLFILVYLLVSLISANFYCCILTPYRRILSPFIACLIFYLIMCLPMTYLMFHMHYLATALMKMLLFLPCLLFFQGRTSMRLMAGLIVITLGYMAELAAAAPVKLINLFIPDINLMPLVLLSQKQYLLYLILSGTDLIVNYICFRALGNVLKDHYRFMTSDIIVLLALPSLCSLLLGDVISILGFNTASFSEFWAGSLFYWIGCIICFFFILIGMNRLKKQEYKQLLQEKQKILVRKQLTYSCKIEEVYHSIRKWNHDYSGHLISLSYLLQQNKFKDAETYIQEITSNINKGI